MFSQKSSRGQSRIPRLCRVPILSPFAKTVGDEDHHSHKCVFKKQSWGSTQNGRAESTFRKTKGTYTYQSCGITLRPSPLTHFSFLCAADSVSNSLPTPRKFNDMPVQKPLR